MYWPNMNADRDNFIQRCEICCACRTDQPKEPMVLHEIPKRPWERFGCGLFEFDLKEYLICAEYSDFFDIDYTAILVKKS